MRNQKTIRVRPCSSAVLLPSPRNARWTFLRRTTTATDHGEKHGNNDRGITRINTDEKSENNPCSSVFIRGPFTVAAETRVGRFCARQLPPRTTEKDGNNDHGITRINTDEKSENNPCSSV